MVRPLGSRYFRGHLCVRFRYSLVIHHYSYNNVVGRLQHLGFPQYCYPSYRIPTFVLVGLTPTKHIHLLWTHDGIQPLRLSDRTRIFRFGMDWSCVAFELFNFNINQFKLYQY
ncbi:hypothetical protein wVul_0561 [Wolbachia endosymbiont of Armadillidium vulgare str. wVulC]|nr:hypothetical protein wVul_0561 [Wolbachia endosymbiont of Armadillidium vulgare str. wVulC]